MSALSLRALSRATAAVLAREPLFFAALIAIGSLPGVAGLFLSIDGQLATSVISGFLGLYLQLLATFRTLDLMGAMPADYRGATGAEGRFPAAVIGSTLSMLATGAGVLVLVVPGLLLLALWGVWMPALAAERLSSAGALHRSWQLGRPRLGALLALVLVMVAVFAALFAAFVIFHEQSLTVELCFEIAFNAALTVNAVAWACVYRALIGAKTQSLADPLVM